MKKLESYLYRNWCMAMVVMLAALLALFFLFTIASELGDVNEHYGVADAFVGTILRLPYFIQVLLPIVLLLGTCIAVTKMACGRELVAIISSGVRPARIASVLLLRAWIPLALLALVNNELLVPWSENMVSTLERPPGEVLPTGGRWLRHGNQHIAIGELGHRGYLQDITIFFYAEQPPRRLQRVAHAEYAIHDDGSWQLFNISSSDTAEFAIRDNIAQQNWQIDLVPESFTVSHNNISTSPLPEVFRHAIHTADSQYINTLWQRVSYPAMLALMLMLGVILVAPASKNYAAVGKAVMVALVYFMLQRITSHSLFTAALSPWLLAVIPFAALLLVTVVLYRYSRA